MSPAEIDALITVGQGARPTLNHIINMESENIKFNDGEQLIKAVKIVSIDPLELTMSMVEDELAEAELPVGAMNYVMKQTKIEMATAKLKVTKVSSCPFSSVVCMRCC